MTLEKLKDDLQKPKDFVVSKMASTRKHIRPFWRVHYRQIVRPYKRLKKRFERYPMFRFLDNATFDDYSTIIQNSQFETVILFSHCKEGGTATESIEFYDRLVSCHEIKVVIPPERKIDIDFAVCNPIRLRLTLESIRGRQFVIISREEKINLGKWLAVYQLVFQEILDHPDQSYSRCFVNVLKSFIS